MRSAVAVPKAFGGSKDNFNVNYTHKFIPETHQGRTALKTVRRWSFIYRRELEKEEIREGFVVYERLGVDK